MKHLQSNSELQNHLQDQLSFLKSSADQFDAGNTAEAKRLAVTIRVLVHDTPRSTSLLQILDLKKGTYYHSHIQASELDPENQAGNSSLIGIVLREDKPAEYVALLDETRMNPVTFDTWWEQPIVQDVQRQQLSRKQLVLAMANKDGGAHIDPVLDIPAYVEISRHGTLGYVGGNLKQPERAIVRQIAHELLRALIPGYRKLRQTKGVLVALEVSARRVKTQ